MYYYKARIYSPTLGRFMQTDPIGYADGLNWYTYVGNNPVNATDPSGLTQDYTDGLGNIWRYACGGDTCSWNSVENNGSFSVGSFTFLPASEFNIGRPIAFIGGPRPPKTTPQSGNILCKLGKALEVSGKVYGDTATGGAVVGGAIGMLGGPEAALGIAGAFLTHAEFGGIAASAGQAVQDLSTGQSLKTTGVRFLAGVAGGRVGQSVGRVARVGTFLSPGARKVLDGAFGKIEQSLIGLGIPEIDPDTDCGR